MPQIKYYITVLMCCLTSIFFSQQGFNEDPEMIQNSIDFYIRESQKDIEKFEYFEAQKKLDKALEIAVTSNNDKNKGIIYAKKGQLQLIIDETSEAKKSLNEALKIQHNINDNKNIGFTYKILGDVYLKDKAYDLALQQYRAAQTKYEEDNNQQTLAEVFYGQGLVYLKLEDHKHAKSYFENAIARSVKYKLSRTQSKALISLSKIYLEQDNATKAFELALESLKIAKENHYDYVMNDGYLVLSDVYNSLNDYKTANTYLKAHIKLTDSLQAVVRENLSPEKKIQFLMNEQIENSKIQKEQLEKANRENDMNTLISILAVALITILSLLTLSLYKNNNIRLKTNNMLHKKNSELIIAKEKAELASKTKANFLSTVTHELRTPLYAVTGLSNMLLDENPKPSQIQHLKSLKFSGDYLLNFINDILQINKIEANKVDLEPESFNLKKKINNIILALNNSAADNNVTIHYEYGYDLPENFIADQLKISQILINLIGNSIKFTKNGDIWIRVNKIEQEGEMYHLRFEVEDNGIGISQEKQENMFESFSQGSIQINRKYGGTGLGLSIVKGLIDILKGKIFVKSELEKGTTFYFEIPLKYTAKKESEDTAPNHFEETNKIDFEKVKILVVEDNKINQMITKKILNKMNLKCEIVDNGEDAVTKIKANSYDVVLMDIHMPGISGIEATKIVRSFDKELTIFALTAVTIEDKMHEFEEAGFTDIIPKPFKQEEFEKKLFNALSKNASKSA